MKRVFIVALIIVIILGLYVGFTLFFRVLFQVITVMQPTPTVIMAPTFTPTPTQAAVVAATLPPPTVPAATVPPDTPTSTLPPTSEPTASPTPLPPPPATDTPQPAVPQVSASTTVNVRSGPGTNYGVVGSLDPGVVLPITGQDGSGTWWQIQQASGSAGWVAGSVVQAVNTANVPVVQVPTPAAPTATPVPPAPAQPSAQFEPTGWYADTNYGLTRFLGNITDANGNPVNGVTVEAQCGTYRVISNPSGPVPAFTSSDSANDPPGFYDITVDRKPVVCKWQLTVVHTEDGQNVLAKLSDTIEVNVTWEKSIIVANWRKNW